MLNPLRPIHLLVLSAFAISVACARESTDSGSQTEQGSSVLSAHDPDRPSENVEGVPGYLSNVGMITYQQTDNQVVIKGPPKTIHLGNESEEVSIQVMRMSRDAVLETASLTRNEINANGVLVAQTKVTADGSFELSTDVPLNDLLFLSVAVKKTDDAQYQYPYTTQIKVTYKHPESLR